MNKKTFIAATIISLLLISLMAGVQIVKVANANFEPLPPPVVMVLSPLNSETYALQYVPLNVTVKAYFGGPTNAIVNNSAKWLSYSLDGKNEILVNLVHNSSEDNIGTTGGPHWFFSGADLLTGLSDGNHSLIIQGESNFGEPIYLRINFNVDISSPSPTPTPTSNLLPSSSQTQTAPASSTTSLTSTPSSSPTQQPPSRSPISVIADPAVDYTPTKIALGALAVTIALGAVAYFYFKKNMK